MYLQCALKNNERNHCITIYYFSIFGDTITRRTIAYLDKVPTLKEIAKRLYYLEIVLKNEQLEDMLKATQRLHKEITRLNNDLPNINFETLKAMI